MIVRTADAADLGPVGDFLGRLSPETGFRRFFTGLGRPSLGLVRRLVARDTDRGAWVAEEGDAVVGHASWTLVDGSDVAELAVVVEDGFQRAGLGAMLIGRAGEEAVAAGARVLRFAVLGENRRVVSWLTRLWPGLTSTTEDGIVVYEVEVVEPYAA
jgi:GNAT superfamily N-acetyltransferase